MTHIHEIYDEAFHNRHRHMRGFGLYLLLETNFPSQDFQQFWGSTPSISLRNLLTEGNPILASYCLA